MNIGSIPIWLGYIFLTMGAFSVAVIVSALCLSLLDAIRNLADRWKYAHKRKHRYDHPPLAKCYCRDCENWNRRPDYNTDGKCWSLNRYKADNWFCWYASPRKTDPDHKENNQ